MNTHVRYKDFGQVSVADYMVYSKLPEHPYWSHVSKLIDFEFADKLCSVLYTGRGQYPYAPSLKLKIHLIQAYYNLSDRGVEEKIIGDLFIKRFLDLPVDFFGFDHSTIGLDRNRMGATMFQACHMYILAQMYSKGLWGDHDEQWIIDSFPTNITTEKHGAYRLIKHAMIRLVQHLKRSNTRMYKQLSASIQLSSLTERLSRELDQAGGMLVFSKLVAEAYGLLQWFRHDDVLPQFASWKQYPESRKLQDILKRVLSENSRPSHPDQTEEELDIPHPEEVPILHEKIPRKERAKDRIEDVRSPEARLGIKNKNTRIWGFKTQNLCTTSGVILSTEVVPANEPDGDAMWNMVKEFLDFFKKTPHTVLADSAYGYGKYRDGLSQIGLSMISPVTEPKNPTGLYGNTRFTYHGERDIFSCPDGKETTRKKRNHGQAGLQYHFRKQDCKVCTLKLECTSNKQGRTVFRSDYAEIYEEARKVNESLEGRAIMKQRNTVERKNNELKNHCGLDRCNAIGLETLTMKATLATIVVNLKHTVRKKVNPNQGFLRRVQRV